MKKTVAYTTVGLFTLIYILSFVDRQIVAVLGTQIRDALELSNFQIGLLYGPAFSFIYALAGIPMGHLADQISRKAMICTGLMIWSVMTVLSGFAASFTFLVTARIFVGLSQAMLSPAVYSYLADTFSPKQRATVFSVYASGIFLGIGSSFLIGGTVSMHYDWRMAMIAVGLPGIVLVPFAWWYIREPKRKTSEQGIDLNMMPDLIDILRKPTVRWHLAGFSFLACTGYTILAFAGNIFHDIHQRPDLIAHYGWFMFGVGGTVIASGKIADWLGRRDPARRFWMGVVAALFGIPFYLIGLFTTSAELAFWMMGIGVLFSSSYNGVAAALIQYFVTSRQRALAGGLYLFVISVAGFGFGPPVAGWLTDAVYSGVRAPALAILTVMLVCSTGAVVSFMMAMRQYHNDAGESESSQAAPTGF